MFGLSASAMIKIGATKLKEYLKQNEGKVAFGLIFINDWLDKNKTGVNLSYDESGKTLTLVLNEEVK